MKRFVKKLGKKTKRVLVAVGVMMCGAIPALATTTDTSPSLDIDFDVSQMFTFAQTMIDAMLPVVYITLGISLGFLIIRSLKSAFNG